MTTDKRAAAIAALIVRDVAEIPDRCSPDDQPEMMLVTSGELTDIVMRRLAALEADDGRALLRQLREWAQNTGQHQVAKLLSDSQGIFAWKWCWTPLLAEIDRLLAAPEQPAPEPASRPDITVTTLRGPVSSATIIDEPAAPHAEDEANAGTSGKGRTDGRVQEVRRQADHLPPVFPGEQVSRRVPDIQVQRGSVADDAASGNECVEERAAPAQPDRGEPERVAHADDEARIEECMHRVGQAMLSLRHDWMLRVYNSDNTENQKRKAAVDAINDVFSLLRSLAAGKANAEAMAHERAEVFSKVEAQNAAEIADLRAKLADAERERDDLREQVGDKGFSLLQQERDEAVEDMLSVAQQVGIVYEAEGHAPKAGPTPAILRAIAAMQRDADDAPRLRSAGVSLKFKLTEATAERDAALAKLAEAEKRLTTAMCNVAEAEDERNDARSSCFAAKAERDAAVAKLADAERQTQRWKVAATALLRAAEERDRLAGLEAARQSDYETLREWLGCKSSECGDLLCGAQDLVEERDRLRAQRDALVAVLEQCDVFLRVHAKPDNELKTAVQAAIRAAKPEPADYADSKFGPWPGAAKPEPAAEPVPAAADAKPGDEVLRRFIAMQPRVTAHDGIGCPSDDALAELCRRALEVRP